jgi:hypothetical protein
MWVTAVAGLARRIIVRLYSLTRRRAAVGARAVVNVAAASLCDARARPGAVGVQDGAVRVAMSRTIIPLRLLPASKVLHETPRYFGVLQLNLFLAPQWEGKDGIFGTRRAENPSYHLTRPRGSSTAALLN